MRRNIEMISTNLVEFLNGPVVLLVGTRDENMRPSGAYAFGCVTDAENDIVTFFLPNVEGEAILRDLKQNGKVALTAVEGISHLTYQFKGTALETRPVSENEKGLQDAYRETVIAHYLQKGVPEGYFGWMVYNPSTAVTFRVEEIFDQTPGPAAGAKMESTSKS
jgi:hypothetical protein